MRRSHLQPAQHAHQRVLRQVATALGSALAVALLLAVLSAKMLGGDWTFLKVGVCEVSLQALCMRTGVVHACRVASRGSSARKTC